MLPFPVCHWGGGRFIDTGLNRYARVTSGLTGTADGRVGTLAMFAKLRDFVQILHMRNSGSGSTLRVSVVVNDSGSSTFRMISPDNQNVIVMDIGSYAAAANIWAWYGWSWNTGAGRAAAYLNDTDLQGGSTIFDTTRNIEYTVDEVSFYATLGGGGVSRGCYAYVFFSTTTEYDFNIEANRRLFLNGDGSPVITFPSGGIVQSITGDLSNNEGSGGNFDLPNGAFLSCVNEP